MFPGHKIYLHRRVSPMGSPTELPGRAIDLRSAWIPGAYLGCGFFKVLKVPRQKACSGTLAWFLEYVYIYLGTSCPQTIWKWLLQNPKYFKTWPVRPRPRWQTLTDLSESWLSPRSPHVPRILGSQAVWQVQQQSFSLPSKQSMVLWSNWKPLGKPQ